MSGYYSEHFNEYIASTINVDMSPIYALFEPLLKGKKILDVGFGSGRDMLYFQSKGYEVFGIDTEPAFVKHAKEVGLDAVGGNAATFRTDEKFDGIWACASLLHLKKTQMRKAIENLKGMLANDGVLFVSLKEGDAETMDENGRIMTFVSKEFLENLGFRILSVTDDAKEREICWLNAAFYTKSQRRKIDKNQQTR